MSLNISSLGWWLADNEISTRPQKVVLPTSDGATIAVVMDPNDAQAPAGFGAHNDSDVISIYKIDAAFGTVSTLATITVTTGLDRVYDKISADLHEDNSVGLTYLRSDGAIHYRKIDYATGSVGAAETVGTITGTVAHLDISVSEANIPAVAWIEKNTTSPKLVLKVNTRRTSDSTWVASTTQTLIGGTDPNNAMTSLSISWAKGGSATSRPLMVAAACATDTDQGTKIYSAVVNEGTGALVNWTLRKTYLAGNMTAKWAYFPRRTYLFRSGNGEITIVHMEAVDKKNLLIARCTWDGNTWTETMPPQVSTAGYDKIDYTGKFAAAYANDRVVFFYTAPASGVMSVYNYIGVINRATASVRYSGPFKWDNLSNNNDGFYPMAGTGKFASLATNPGMVYFTKTTAGAWNAKAHNVKAAPAPTAVTPSGGTTLTGMPALGMRASLNKQWPQSNHKAIWQFALDSAFTTSVKTYIQDDSKFTKIENTQAAGSYVYIADTLPEELSLSSGNWYVRGALVDEFGIQGAWSVAGTVGLSHPPSAANIAPNSGVYVASGNVSFTWVFTDPLLTDVQTAYQIIVERNDDGTVLLDTGKVINGGQGHVASITTTGTLLRWKIRVWDGDDTAGNYSDYATFAVAGPPTVTIDAPTPASVVTSGTPAILFTPTTTGGRNIKAYQVVIKKDGTVVKNSGTVAVDVASGTQLTWRPPSPLLDSAAGYSAQVFVTDETSIPASSAEVSFTISQNAPATAHGVTASTSQYNVENAGYVTVSWDDTTRDVDFEAWVIERKDDLLASDMSVVALGTWAEIAEVKQTMTNYNYLDYYAPSGYRSSYRVRQLVNRAGDRSISTADTVVDTFPSSDGYWIIQPASATGATVSFRLASVTEDSYSPEWEENEYTIIGRGRHIDKGDYLGAKGSLTAKLRDSTGSTARQKKLQLEDARDSDSEVYLRNPFGDVWPVSIGNLGISRIAGVGKSEFVDVEVPYSQVAP